MFLALIIKKFKRGLLGLWKNVLYFRKLNFLAESLKYSYFFSKKNYQISGRNLQSLKNKDYLYFLLTGRNMDGSKATSQIGDNAFKSMKKKKQA